MSTRDICPKCGSMYSLHDPSCGEAPREWWTAESRLTSCDCLCDTNEWGEAFKPFKVIEKSAYYELAKENKRLFDEMITAQGCQENAEKNLEHAKFYNEKLQRDNLLALDMAKKFADERDSALEMIGQMEEVLNGIDILGACRLPSEADVKLKMRDKARYGLRALAEGRKGGSAMSIDGDIHGECSFKIRVLERGLNASMNINQNCVALIHHLEAQLKLAAECRTNEDAWAAVEIERGCLREIELWRGEK